MIELVFDRTQTDVDHAERLVAAGADIPEDLKGAYNVSDRNRVGGAINELAEFLGQQGYPSGAHGKADWDSYTLVTPELNAETVENISRMRRVFPVFPDAPDTPGSLDNITYQQANDIERILFDMSELAKNMSLEVTYCDEIYAGEGDWI